MAVFTTAYVRWGYNITATAPVDWRVLLENHTDLFGRALLFFILGLCIMVLNGLIVATYARDKTLNQRKEYLVIASVALADSLYGSAYVLLGGGRLYHFFNGTYLMLAPSRDYCVFGLLFGVVTFVPMHCACAPCPDAGATCTRADTMLICMSFDRLVAVSTPMFYFRASRWYSVLLVGGHFAVSLLISAYFLANAGAPDFWPDYRCNGGSDNIAFGFLGWYFKESIWARYRWFCSLFSIVLYLLLLVIYIARGIFKSGLQTLQTAEARRQKTLITTLGILCLCTFIFQVNVQWVFLRFHYNWLVRARLYGYILPWGLLNPLVNIVVYLWRQTEFRTALLRHWGCVKFAHK